MIFLKNLFFLLCLHFFFIYGIQIISFINVTPIFTAVSNEDYEIVKTLLRASANCEDPVLLQTAILQNNSSIVELLLKYGADPNRKDEHQKSAFDFLSLPEQQEIEELLKTVKPLPPINQNKRFSCQLTPMVTSVRELFDRLPPAPQKREDPPINIEIM